MNDEEREAIERLRRGDMQGLETLVHLHQLGAVRVAYAITHSRPLAEDAVAEAFLTAYERIGRFDASRPFRPWFYRIVVHGALKAARAAGRTDASEAALELLERQRDPAPGPEDSALRAETRETVAAGVRSLPPKQRAVLVLRYYLQMEEAEIARTLGCPVGTVKWRLHAARARLRRLFSGVSGFSGRGIP